MVMPDCKSGFPEGFAIVSAALKASGRTVFTLNLRVRKNPVDDLARAIVDNNIDVLMTGGTSFHYGIMFDIIKSAKNINPNIITVMGGMIITADPVVAMKALEPYVDYGVIGEAEITVNALAYALENDEDPSMIDGIVCKRDGEWSVRENYPFVKDLNILPFPDYDGFEYSKTLVDFYERYTFILTGTSKVLFLSTSRGCPYSCTFCASYNKKYRQKTNDTVFRQLDWALSLYPDIEAIRFCDDLTFADEATALELCARLKPYGLTFRATARVNMISEKTLSAMKDSGCTGLLIGIESASNEVLKSMRKMITIEQVEKVLAYGAEIGLNVRGSLIFGDEEETWETACASLRWWQKNNKWDDKAHVWNLELSPIGAFPGSQLYKNARERGIITDPVQFLKDGITLYNLSKMSDDEYRVINALLHIRTNWGVGISKDVQITLPADYRIDGDNITDYIVNFAGVCSHCNELMKWKSYLVNPGRLSCPFCKKYVSANPIEHLNVDTSESVLGNGGVAVWPATFHNFYWLMEYIPEFKKDHVRFVNPNKVTIPNKDHVLKTLGGKELFTPDILQSGNIETVVITSARAADIRKIKEQIAECFPQVKRVIHVGELL